MRLYFKQRFFSWFDSYDIYDEGGDVFFSVQGRLAWGHRLEIYNSSGAHIGDIVERIFTFLPRYELYTGGRYIGEIKKEFTFFKQLYTLGFNGWSVQGDFLGWDYRAQDRSGNTVMTASKQLFNWTDTYFIEFANPADALVSLMIVLAIDITNCRNS